MSQLAFNLKVCFNKERKPLLERTCYVSDITDIDLVSIVKAVHSLYGKSSIINLQINGL